MNKTAKTAEAVDPRLERARQLLDEGDRGLESLGRRVGLSAGHLQRSFRAAYGLSPAEYRAQVKLGELKRGLRGKSDVTRALVDAGYGSPSRVYEDGAARLGMPARHFVAATNVNDTVPRYLASGCYRPAASVAAGCDHAV